MKNKFILGFMMLLISITFNKIRAQQHSLFDSLINMMPVRKLPFVFSLTKQTPFEIPLKEIPFAIAEKFVCSQGVRCGHDCDQKYFYGLLAFGKFIVPQCNYHLLVFAYDLVTGCPEKFLMISYDSGGKITDTLMVYGNGYLTKPDDRNKFGEMYRVESEISEKFEIKIIKDEKIGPRIKEDKKIKRRLRKIEYLYEFSQEGKFIKKEERIIFDGMIYY